jgi:hypothetical protein
MFLSIPVPVLVTWFPVTSGDATSGHLYECIFYICYFLFVCLLVFVNKMLFIIQALHYNKTPSTLLYELDLQHRQSSRRRLHCVRSPLYILSDTQMYRKIDGRCYENIETSERIHRHSQGYPVCSRSIVWVRVPYQGRRYVSSSG